MNYLIIGASAAGIAAAESLRAGDKEAGITVVSEERLPLYSRCLLTYLIAGSINEDKLNFKDKKFYENNNIKTYLGKKAVAIDAENKKVSLDDGLKISYDKLLIVAGASALNIKIPGADKKGVFVLRNIEDARKIMEVLPEVKRIVILGGGLVGLRAAYAFKQKQKDVTVVVKSPYILSQITDKEAAGMLNGVLKKNGINIITGAAAKEIAGGRSVEAVILDNGEKIDGQLVIVGKGVKPNTGLSLSAGIDGKDAIKVDAYLRTSRKDIFAAGDVAQTMDIARQAQKINALWPCAVEQGRIAGLNMSGGQVVYEGSVSMNSVDFFGTACISMGIVNQTEGQSYEIICRLKENSYKKFVLKENVIVGMVLVNDIKNAGVIGALIKKRTDVSSIKHMLLDDTFNYAKVMPLVEEFKEDFGEAEYKDAIVTY